eukprot:291703_1
MYQCSIYPRQKTEPTLYNSCDYREYNMCDSTVNIPLKYGMQIDYEMDDKSFSCITQLIVEELDQNNDDVINRLSMNVAADITFDNTKTTHMLFTLDPNGVDINAHYQQIIANTSNPICNNIVTDINEFEHEFNNEFLFGFTTSDNDCNGSYSYPITLYWKSQMFYCEITPSDPVPMSYLCNSNGVSNQYYKANEYLECDASNKQTFYGMEIGHITNTILNKDCSTRISSIYVGEFNALSGILIEETRNIVNNEEIGKHVKLFNIDINERSNATHGIYTEYDLHNNDGWQLLARHQNIEYGYFSPEIRISGIENIDIPGENTYCQIGAIKYPEYYQDDNNSYTFKLEYVLNDGRDLNNSTFNKTYEIIWQQKSWLTERYIEGYKPIIVPDAYFGGLSLSNNSNDVYLDGDAAIVSDSGHVSTASVGTIIPYIKDTSSRGIKVTNILTAKYMAFYIATHQRKSAVCNDLISITITACHNWDYASFSNSLQMQIKGVHGASQFFYVNKHSSLPTNGATKIFMINDIKRLSDIGELYSVILSMADNQGFCIKSLVINILNI